MKKFLLSFLFIFATAQAIFPAEISIAQVEIPNWRFGGANVTLRAFPNTQFQTADGKIIPAGSVTNNAFYKETDCSLVGTTLTCAAFEGANKLDSTTDSNVPSAGYTFVVFEGRTRRLTYLSDMRIPHTLGATISFAQIQTYNQTAPRPPTPTYPTMDMVSALVAGVPIPSKNSIGLGNVNNTSDADKPLSNAVVAALTGKQNTSQKGQANGYASLDADGKLPMSQVPAGIGASNRNDQVQNYANLSAALGAIGSVNATTLNINTQILCTSALAIPANITLEFTNSGRITDAGGCTVQFAGNKIVAPADLQIFENFSPGEITFTGDAPSEISPVWFGAKRMTGYTPPYNTNTDTLSAVQQIAAAFLKTGQDAMRQGTMIKFPCGDFYFSDTWTIQKAFSVVGCESNAFWSHGTRLYFPKNKSGIVIRKGSYLGGSGADERPNGFILRNLEIRADFTVTTDSVVNVTGLTMSHVSGADFGAPLNDGDTVRLADGMNVVVKRQRRSITATVASGQTALTSPDANFTSADVGADISFPVSNVVVKIQSVTNATTAVLTAGAPGSVSGTFAYLTSAKTLTIDQPEFVMSLSPGNGADIANGYQWVSPVASNINRSATYYVGQSVVFYHGNGTQTTHTILEVSGNAIRISNPLSSVNVPGSGIYTLGIVQSLNNQTNQAVRLNKWAGIDVFDGAHGLIDRVRVTLFAGDGIRADSDLRQGNGGTNSNMLRISNSHVELNDSNGYHGSGADSNAILLDNLNAINNGGYGIYDDGYLGIAVNAGHVTDNISGSIYTKHDSTNTSTFTGVYLEGAAPPVNVGAGAIFTGGQNGVGFHPQSQLSAGFLGGDLSGGATLYGGGLVTRNKTGTMSARFSGTENANYFLRGGGRYSDGYRYVIEWGMGYGNLADYIYFTNLGEELAGLTFAIDVNEKHAFARKMRVGDGTSNYNNFTQFQSATAKPTFGSYPKGAIVTNRDYDEGEAAAWINKTANGANFDALYSSRLAVNAQSGTSYTLTADDLGKTIILTNASAITLTVPAGLGAGFSCLVIQGGGGQITFAASGATVTNRSSHTKTGGQGALASLIAPVANTFYLGGDTTN